MAWADELEDARLQIEMIRLLKLDRLTAAAESGHLDLVESAVQALAKEASLRDTGERLRAAARHAMEHDQSQVAAYLQALLAARTIDHASQAALAVRQL